MHLVRLRQEKITSPRANADPTRHPTYSLHNQFDDGCPCELSGLDTGSGSSGRQLNATTLPPPVAQARLAAA